MAKRIVPKTSSRDAVRSAAILIGHGSKVKGFDAPMKELRRALIKKKVFFRVHLAYLDINAPSIPAAIDMAVRQGAKEVRLLPYFLLAGRHVTEHIPETIRQSRKKHGKKIRLTLCPYLGYHPGLLDIALERFACR